MLTNDIICEQGFILIDNQCISESCVIDDKICNNQGFCKFDDKGQQYYCDCKNYFTQSSKCSSCSIFNKLIIDENGDQKCIVPQCYTETEKQQECGGNGSCIIISSQLNIGMCLCKDQNAGDKCVGCKSGYKYSEQLNECVIDKCNNDCGNGTCYYDENVNKYKCKCNNYYSEESNCKQCLYQFDSSTQCTQCIGKYDINTLCYQCEQGYTQKSKCTKCRNNYNISHNCKRCNNGYDIMNACLTCTKNHYLVNNICVQQQNKLSDSPLLIGFLVFVLLIVFSFIIYIIIKIIQKRRQRQFQRRQIQKEKDKATL